jgi:hypothetical protein
LKFKLKTKIEELKLNFKKANVKNKRKPTGEIASAAKARKKRRRGKS